MAMKFGNQGFSMWPQCLDRGVAAITYEVLGKTDLSKFPKDEPKQLWDQLEPTQKSSLAKVAYKIKPGDTIYVKEGTSIVCRGKVTGPYHFDARGRIVCPGYEHDPFSHQVPVEWESDFVPMEILLGAEPTTVLELKGDRLRRLEDAVKKANIEVRHSPKSQEDAVLEALEGEAYRAECLFRQRNAALIHAKKMASNGRCSVCDFCFAKRYSGIIQLCLDAHHVNPIGTRKTATKTTLADIDLLCPNCHRAVHTQKPPLSAAKLKTMLR
jgi:5-methylcytosine-specific restriction endonuclease McrA